MLCRLVHPALSFVTVLLTYDYTCKLSIIFFFCPISFSSHTNAYCSHIDKHFSVLWTVFCLSVFVCVPCVNERVMCAPCVQYFMQNTTYILNWRRDTERHTLSLTDDQLRMGKLYVFLNLLLYHIPYTFKCVVAYCNTLCCILTCVSVSWPWCKPCVPPMHVFFTPKVYSIKAPI